MKKFLVILLATVFILPQTSSFAAEKPCSKSLVKKIRAGSVCTKVGSVYRWKALLKPTPTPTLTPTPTVWRDPLQGTLCAIEYATMPNQIFELTCLKDSVGNPGSTDNRLYWFQNNRSPGWVPTPTPTVKPLSEIKKLQIKIVDSFKIEKNINEINFIVIQSPSVNKDRVEKIVNSYKIALAKFNSPTNKKINLVFMNETDKDWWLQTSRKLDGPAHDSWWNNPSCRISVTALCAYSPGGMPHISLYTMIGSSTFPNGLEEMLWYHEATHLYQFQLQINQKGYPNCWIIEGQANALGFAFASKSFDNSKERSMILTHDIARVFPNYKQYSKEDWINNFIKLTGDFSYCINLSAGYSVGMLAVESLYYYNDAEKVNSFISHYYSTPETFESSLKSILGIDLNRFYSNFAEYSMTTLNN